MFHTASWRRAVNRHEDVDAYWHAIARNTRTEHAMCFVGLHCMAFAWARWMPVNSTVAGPITRTEPIRMRQTLNEFIRNNQFIGRISKWLID